MQHVSKKRGVEYLPDLCALGCRGYRDLFAFIQMILARHVFIRGPKQYWAAAQ